MAKKAAPTQATKATKPAAKEAQTPERRSTRSATTAATPTTAAPAAAKPTSASKKRKTAEDFLEDGQEKEGVKKARGPAPVKKAAAEKKPVEKKPVEKKAVAEKKITEKEVSIAKPAVTATTTADQVPLPTTKKAAAPKGKKAGKTAAAPVADAGAVQPSAEKPAEGLKSALKKPTKAAPAGKKTTPAPAKKAAPKKTEVVEDGFVHGFSSSEGEESDDDDSDIDMDGPSGKSKAAAVDVKTLPTIAKDDKSVQRKLTKAKKKQVRF
jgi:nucleolar protein 15